MHWALAEVVVIEHAGFSEPHMTSSKPRSSRALALRVGSMGLPGF